jgi:hypothetical protein
LKWLAGEVAPEVAEWVLVRHAKEHRHVYQGHQVDEGPEMVGRSGLGREPRYLGRYLRSRSRAWATLGRVDG